MTDMAWYQLPGRVHDHLVNQCMALAGHQPEWSRLLSSPRTCREASEQETIAVIAVHACHCEGRDRDADSTRGDEVELGLMK
jgi:hypothetical protein